MNKKMCLHIVVCGLLSCSFGIFGMEKKGASIPTTPNNTANVSPQPEQSFLDKVEQDGEEILDHLKKADNVVYGLGHGILEDLKEQPKVLVGFMKLGGMNQQNAQNTTGIVEDTVGLVEAAQDDVHELIQDLGKAQISPQPTSTTATK